MEWIEEPELNPRPKEWEVRTRGTRTNKAREVSPPVDVKLVCAIGHKYRGTVRRIIYNGYDMDGDEFWHQATNDYDPPTCVVCGLSTWQVVKEE